MKSRNEKICDNCKNFYPHFNIESNIIHKVHCGHCKMNVKNVYPTKTACENYEHLTKTVIKKRKDMALTRILENIDNELNVIKLYIENR